MPSGISLCTPPTANDASATTNEDTTITITLSGSDADEDNLTFNTDSPPNVPPENGFLFPIITTGPTTATVDYQPNQNFNGVDSFTYTVSDGNGGTDTANVNITVIAVNDAPSFTAGDNVTVNEDSGAYSATWATAISAGPANESGQTVSFLVINNTNPALFSEEPAISSSGTLTFTPAPTANGVATVTVVLHDDGGTANGGVDTSPAQQFNITVISPP